MKVISIVLAVLALGCIILSWMFLYLPISLIAAQAGFIAASLVAGASVAIMFVSAQIYNKLEIQITEASRLDPITNLLNRKALLQSLGIALKSAERHQHLFGMILIGLDQFNQVNARFTQVGGNTILKQVGDLLQSQIRQEDILGRFEGDQFLIGAPYTPLDGLTVLAKRLHQTLISQKYCAKAGETKLSACISLIVSPPSAYNLDSLLDDLTKGLKTAKSIGQNRIYTEGDAGRAASKTRS
jgi:diguanylate cyclase (GGDEF)-like protein